MPSAVPLESCPSSPSLSSAQSLESPSLRPIGFADQTPEVTKNAKTFGKDPPISQCPEPIAIVGMGMNLCFRALQLREMLIVVSYSLPMAWICVQSGQTLGSLGGEEIWLH